MKNYVYLNGKIVPEDKACISVFDRGLSYGDGLFETMLASVGSVRFLKEHIERLKKGALAIGIPKGALKILEEDIRGGVIKKLLKINGLSSRAAYLRITVTRGVDKGGHLPSKGLNPTIIIITKPVDIETVSKYRKRGVKAVLIKGCSPALPHVKSLNYLPNVLGRIEAKKRKAVEGIFVNEDSSLLEGTSTNIFLLIKGVLKTPPLSRVLPGITRQLVITLAGKNGIRVEETTVYTKDLKNAEEAFLTNSILGIVPLIGVESWIIGDGTPGPATRSLQEGLLESMILKDRLRC